MKYHLTATIVFSEAGQSPSVDHINTKVESFDEAYMAVYNRVATLQKMGCGGIAVTSYHAVMLCD